MAKYISRYGTDGFYLKKKPELDALKKVSAIDLIKAIGKEMRNERLD